jgi:hypothetical protein
MGWHHTFLLYRHFMFFKFQNTNAIYEILLLILIELKKKDNRDQYTTRKNDLFWDPFVSLIVCSTSHIQENLKGHLISSLPLAIKVYAIFVYLSFFTHGNRVVTNLPFERTHYKILPALSLIHIHAQFYQATRCVCVCCVCHIRCLNCPRGRKRRQPTHSCMRRREKRKQR